MDKEKLSTRESVLCYLISLGKALKGTLYSLQCEQCRTPKRSSLHNMDCYICSHCPYLLNKTAINASLTTLSALLK